MPSFFTTFGSNAESATCQWLEGQGFQILDRNWRRPWGELDIVAQKDSVVHFIEVKASLKQNAGFEPFVRAGATKMLKVQRTARTWLATHNYGDDTEWQMDIVSVIMGGEGNTPEFEHFESI